ncbi:transposase [Nitrosomonas communis]|uniref:transposase n=1 Tax=Nitrosomonas communis TaxID=44574 RepID=UPI003D2A6D42
MNRDTKRLGLPSLIGDLFDQSELQIDNIFASLRNQLYVVILLHRAGLHKCSGVTFTQVVYWLLMWVWLKVDSIDMTSRKSMQSFSDARKDVMYDYLKWEDVSRRRLHYQIARQVVIEHKFEGHEMKAFVLGDSVKTRRGKKITGISSHFDQLTGRTVKGQQVLTISYTTEEVFLPLDSELYISQKNIAELNRPFCGGRCHVTKHY